MEGVSRRVSFQAIYIYTMTLERSFMVRCSRLSAICLLFTSSRRLWPLSTSPKRLLLKKVVTNRPVEKRNLSKTGVGAEGGEGMGVAFSSREVCMRSHH